jgi:hypothetical protein
MTTNEGPHSEYFDELCALAAGGQISEVDFIELRDHLQRCDQCRASHGDFIDLIHNKLPLADPELSGPSRRTGLFSEGSSYRDRFLTRVRKEGLAASGSFSHDIPASKSDGWLTPRFGFAHLAAVATFLLVVTTGVFGYAWRQSSTRNLELVSELAAMTRQVNQQSKLESSSSTDTKQQTPRYQIDSTTTPSSDFSAAARMDAELERARREYEEAEARASLLQEKLQAINSQLQSSGGQLEESENMVQLRKNLENANQTIAQINSDMLSARESRTRYAQEAANQANRIKILEQQLSARTEDSERTKPLLAKAREITELIGSRNFHAVEVRDIDTKGRESQAFGHYFFAEGEQLTMYVFDLVKPAATTKKVYQVWGTRGPNQALPLKLGVLNKDDVKLNRWKLEVYDPSILTEIDSVFVTEEASGGSLTPNRTQLLYHSLKG